jgi:hypothetical protein
MYTPSSSARLHLLRPRGLITHWGLIGKPPGGSNPGVLDSPREQYAWPPSAHPNELRSYRRECAVVGARRFLRAPARGLAPARHGPRPALPGPAPRSHPHLRPSVPGRLVAVRRGTLRLSDHVSPKTWSFGTNSISAVHQQLQSCLEELWHPH